MIPLGAYPKNAVTMFPKISIIKIVMDFHIETFVTFNEPH